MASNKVIINSEANSVVISEPVGGSRIVKVIEHLWFASIMKCKEDIESFR